MTMENLDKAQEIAGMVPLPSDAKDQIKDLIDKSTGLERDLIGFMAEAVIVQRLKSGE